MDSVVLETEAADGTWEGTEAGGNNYRADVMRGMRADIRQEKAGVSRTAADAAAKLARGG